MLKSLVFILSFSIVAIGQNPKKSVKSGRYIASLNYKDHEKIRIDTINEKKTATQTKNFDLYKINYTERNTISSSVYHTGGETAVFGFKFDSPF